jgi:sporulation related protein
VTAQPQTATSIIAFEGSTLVSENRMLLRVLFVALALLGPLFTTGYTVGRLTAVTVPSAQGPVMSLPLAAAPPLAEAPPIVATTENAPAQPEAAPHPEESAAAAIPQRPALHGTYLQLATTRRHQPLVERLRKKGFDPVALEVPAKPGLYRVLVGPLQKEQVAQIRAELQLKGLAAKSAFARVF